MEAIQSVTVEVEEEGDNPYVKLDYIELMKVADESLKDSKPPPADDYLEKTRTFQPVLQQQVCVLHSIVHGIYTSQSRFYADVTIAIYVTLWTLVIHGFIVFWYVGVTK